MPVLMEVIRKSIPSLGENRNLEKVRDELSETEKRSRFILFTTLVAFAVFLCGIGIAYFGSIETLEIRMLLILGIFLSGAIAVTGALAGLASLGAFLTVRQLDVLRARIEVAESMDEIEVMWKIFERVRRRAPEIVESVLNEEEVKKALQYHDGLASRFEEIAKLTEGH